MMYKKLICFDFDSTLIHTPTSHDGKIEWEKKMGMSFPSNGWWGSAESLNTNVFYPPVNGWVYKYYEKYMNDPEAYVFLATGRLKKLEPQVLDVLGLHGITFKPSKDSKTGVYCNTGGETFNFKKHLFEAKIRENPNATEFILFDDRHEHLIKFVEWSKHQPVEVKIVDVLNKTEMKTKHLNNI